MKTNGDEKRLRNRDETPATGRRNPVTWSNARSPPNFHLAPIDGAAGRRILFPALKPRLSLEDFCPVLTQQQVALIMGISRARVCQHERAAMRRLQECLDPFHPGNAHDVVVVAPRMRRSREREGGPGAAQCGWLRVTKLTGNGIFSPETICFAFNELRLIHKKCYRPPIVVGDQVGYASAAAMDEGNLAVEVWLARAGQILSRIGRCSVELEVEIIHDIPVIAAGVVAAESLQGF